MNPRHRRRRKWIVFCLVLTGIPVFAYVAYGLALSTAFAQL